MCREIGAVLMTDREVDFDVVEKLRSMLKVT